MGAAPVRRMARGTVCEALETYLQWLRDQGRDNTARTIERKFKQVVWDDPMATIPLHSLTKDDVKEWRDRLREGRQPRSINRIVRDLKAGLNRALKEGHVGDRETWALDLLADDIEDSGDSAVILESHHRKALIKAALPAGGEFIARVDASGGISGRPQSLLGYEVIESSELQAVSAGNMPVIFGDLEQAYIWASHERGLRVIRDDITTPGSTKFYISLQCGGKPGDTRALKALHIA